MRVDVLRRRTKHSNLCSDEGRGRVHWFQNTVEDCGLKPILFHYSAIPIRVSLFSYIRRDPKILLQKSITPYIM